MPRGPRWVRACGRCRRLDLDSVWPVADCVGAWAGWRCHGCLSSHWEPAPIELCDLGADPGHAR